MADASCSIVNMAGFICDHAVLVEAKWRMLELVYVACPGRHLASLPAPYRTQGHEFGRATGVQVSLELLTVPLYQAPCLHQPCPTDV